MSVLWLQSCAYFSVTVGFFFVATFYWLLWESTGDYSSTKDQLQQTQDLMTAPVMLGKIDPDRKYAVFSTTSAGSISESLGFIFQLPLTALAWKRIGFDSVVIVVGSADVWNSDPLLYTVLSRVRELDAVVVFVNVHPANSVMVSKVSRIFAANLLLKAANAGGNGWNRDVIDNVYLVTSDADLWPISGNAYDLPDGVDVLSLNAFCCSSFKHDTRTFPVLSVANIVARISTWRDLTYRNGRSPSDGYELVDYMNAEFGDVAVEQVHKGKDLDQKLVGILISDWIAHHGRGRVRLVARNTETDRIDRYRINRSPESIVDKLDAHLMNNAYVASVWDRVTPLLAALHGNASEQFAWSLSYYEKFTRLLEK